LLTHEAYKLGLQHVTVVGRTDEVDAEEGGEHLLDAGIKSEHFQVVIQLQTGVLVELPVLDHLVDIELGTLVYVVCVGELALELDTTVDQELHVLSDLVVQLEVDFYYVGLYDVLIFFCHFELVCFILAFRVLFKVLFLQLFIYFVPPVLSKSVLNFDKVFE